MKLLVVLAFVAAAHGAPQLFNSFDIPTVLPDGHLADTPEVAAAKVAHFAEHVRLSGASGHAIAPIFTKFDYTRFNNPFYNGPLTGPTVLPNGYLADTPEVAAAKSAHFSEYARIASGAPAPVLAITPLLSHFNFNPYYKSYYRGPLAIPVVQSNGYLADTPEVAAAKANHYAEHAKALAIQRF